jgi:hypothetical protein
VQYELNSAAGMNLDLVKQFSSIGYDSYRLLPGLNLLVPFDAGSPPDPYLLNLFCCNADVARRLAERGLLLRYTDFAPADDPLDKGFGNELLARFHWRYSLAHLPYVELLSPQWEMTESAEESADVRIALACYACSRDGAFSMRDRFRALRASFSQLRTLCDRDPARLRLASLARVANDYGERAVAVNALTRLTESIRQTRVIDPNEPFLAPLERFDSVAPGEKLGDWVQGAVLEQLERRERFSSFYVGPRALGRLEFIHALGFGSPEMERRLELVRLCIAQATAAKARPGTNQAQ